MCVVGVRFGKVYDGRIGERSGERSLELLWESL